MKYILSHGEQCRSKNMHVIVFIHLIPVGFMFSLPTGRPKIEGTLILLLPFS